MLIYNTLNKFKKYGHIKTRLNKSYYIINWIDEYLQIGDRVFINGIEYKWHDIKLI